MRYVAAGITDIGTTRSTNEDSFGISDNNRLYIVADGMGGHAAGEVASRMAVDVISEFMAASGESEITLPFDVPQDLPPVAQRLVAAVKQANQKIFELGRADSRYSGMGTTIVNLAIEGDKAFVAHAGDSRVYLIRSDSIRQITRDHSLVKDYVSQGILREEDTAAHPLRHVITRALGTSPQVEVDVNTADLREGDWLLLCSDGLSNPLPDNELLGALKSDTPITPEDGCKRLIDLALRKGADDNITVILVACLK